MKRKVVITGIGCVTPLGNNSQESWKNLISGGSGITKITSFNAQNFPCNVAGEIKNFRGDTYNNEFQYPRAIQFLLSAVEEAYKDAKLSRSFLKNKRVGFTIGVSAFVAEVEEILQYYRAKKNDRLDAFYKNGSIKSFTSTYNLTPLLSSYDGIYGPHLCIDTACSSSSQAIGEALQMIRNNEVDIVIAGGCSSLTDIFGVTSFTLLGALSKSNISRPFDALRDGFILAEGAGAIIMEELTHALTRSAPIYAEIAGYGCTMSAYRMTDSTPDGDAEAQAMKLALEDANFEESSVSYICAHGTSTKQNDWTETLAIKKIFGEAAYSIPISSNKSQIGHTIAAAGVISVIFTALAMKAEIAPPTINYKNKDPLCDLDYIPNESRRMKINSALVNAFAFGGHNTSLLLRRV